MHVLSIVHDPLAGPELFGEVVVEEGHELRVWEIPAGGEPPAGAVDAVLVLGGHMNVGEEAAHPWLEREYDLLRGYVADGTPLLGICLGAQTLAHAMGGRVALAPPRQAGFIEVELAPAAGDDPVLGSLPQRFPALFANRYAFQLPPGGVELVSSPARVQGYRVGARAWGLQFHPEVRLVQMLGWIDRADDLPRSREALGREVEAGIGSWNAIGAAICRGFLAAAEATRAGSPAANSRDVDGAAARSGRSAQGSLRASDG